MDDCCASDFSRQRAVVVINPVPVMVSAVSTALASLDSQVSDAELERVLVQLDQLAKRTGIDPRSRSELARVVDDVRQSITAGDPEAALDGLRAAQPVLCGLNHGPTSR